MIDNVLSKLLEHGPWGLLVAVLLLGIAALWRNLDRAQTALLEQALSWQRILQDNTTALNAATHSQHDQVEVIRQLSEANRVNTEAIRQLTLLGQRGS